MLTLDFGMVGSRIAAPSSAAWSLPCPSEAGADLVSLDVPASPESRAHPFFLPSRLASSSTAWPLAISAVLAFGIIGLGAVATATGPKAKPAQAPVLLSARPEPQPLPLPAPAPPPKSDARVAPPVEEPRPAPAPRVEEPPPATTVARAASLTPVVPALPTGVTLPRVPEQPKPAAPLPPSEEMLSGVWAPQENACSPRLNQKGLLPAVISKEGAWAGETSCAFKNGRKTGPNSWSFTAACTSGRSKWKANVRLAVAGNRLTWTSQRGTQTYVRCGQALLRAETAPRAGQAHAS